MARDLVKPKKLKKGDTIALIAPSSWGEPADTAMAVTQIEKLGYKVFLHPQCAQRDYISAGSPEDKIKALHEVFADPNIDAVFSLRGGHQAVHLLDKIDYELIRKNPKIFIGYSDTTALHAAFLERSRMVSFHSPSGGNVRFLADPALTAEHKSINAMFDFYSGNTDGNLFRDAKPVTIQSGEAEGILWGGNISLICALIEAGSRYHPPLDKSILMIEEVSEELFKLDRVFGSWRLRGIFKNLAGLVMGHMTTMRDTSENAGPFTYGVEEILRRHTNGMIGPVVAKAPFGHEHPNYVFPQGVKAKLKADKKGEISLNLLESPFAD